MTYKPFVVEEFAGLNLLDDPEGLGVSGAIDLLNVEARRGRVYSRYGYNNLTASAAASRLDNIAPFYKTGGTKQVLVSSLAGQFYRAYDTAGAIVTGGTQAVGLNVYEADFTRFGGPGAEVVYAASSQGVPSVNQSPNDVYKWNGTTWATATGVRLGGAGNYPHMLDVKAADNRLVGVFIDSNNSRVGFSNEGVPETWDANNYEDLTPGDGERITALQSWRELVFVFKESKFFVFGGTSTSGTGTPIFDYRVVNTGVGAVGRACTIGTPNGVYFISRRGIYKTTGADPVLVSRAVDPIFNGGATSFYTGGVLNHAAIDKCQMTWHDERLYFAYPSGVATTNDRMLVFDPSTDLWTLWNIAANGLMSFRIGDQAELVFTYAAGSNHIGRHSSAYFDDDGTAITSRYQSGFYELGTQGATAYTRRTRLVGSGVPTLSIITDTGGSDANEAAVTLASSPAVTVGYVEGWHQVSYGGRLFSHRLSGTTTWGVNRLQHEIAGERP